MGHKIVHRLPHVEARQLSFDSSSMELSMVVYPASLCRLCGTGNKVVSKKIGKLSKKIAAA
jgi:hypothetical protein